MVTGKLSQSFCRSAMCSPPASPSGELWLSSAFQLKLKPHRLGRGAFLGTLGSGSGGLCTDFQAVCSPASSLFHTPNTCHCHWVTLDSLPSTIGFENPAVLSISLMITDAGKEVEALSAGGGRKGRCRRADECLGEHSGAAGAGKGEGQQERKWRGAGKGGGRCQHCPLGQDRESGPSGNGETG